MLRELTLHILCLTVSCGYHFPYNSSDYARTAREKHAEYETKINGCEAALNSKRAAEAKHLKERLARKRKTREQGGCLPDYSRACAPFHPPS